MEIVVNDGEPPIEEIVEEIEVSEWESVRLEVVANNAILRDVLAEVRQQNQTYSTLVPSLLETNTRLTQQIQESQATTLARMTELLIPLQSPTPVIVMPLTDDSPMVVPESEEPKVAEETVEEELPPAPPEPEKPRRKFRLL
jgi:hypothetical protein